MVVLAAIFFTLLCLLFHSQCGDMKSNTTWDSWTLTPKERGQHKREEHLGHIAELQSIRVKEILEVEQRNGK